MRQESTVAAKLLVDGQRARERFAYGEARDAYERAVALQRLVGDDLVLATTLDTFAGLLSDLREFELADGAQKESLDLRRAHLGDEHQLVATSLQGLGEIALKRGDLQRAATLASQSLTTREAVLGSDHPDTSESLHLIGAVERESGRYSAARDLFERALEIRRRNLGADHPDVASSLESLGGVCHLLDDYRGAEVAAQEALDIRRRVLDGRHPSVADSLDDVGLLKQRRGDIEGALAYFEDALEIRQAVLAPSDPRLADSYRLLGNANHVLGAFDEALPFLEKALEIKRGAFGATDRKVARILTDLGHLLVDKGDYAGSLERFEEALRIREDAFGPNHPSVADSLDALSHVTYRLGDAEASQRLLERALSIRVATYGEAHLEVAGTLNNMGANLLAMGAAAKASELFLKAFDILRLLHDEMHPDLAVCLYNLANAHLDTGDLVSADTYAGKALEIQRAAFGDDHPDLCLSLLQKTHSGFLLRQDPVEAANLIGEALGVALLSDNAPMLIHACSRMSDLRFCYGTLDEAIFFGKKAVNAIQRLRTGLSRLTNEHQQSFLTTMESIYRNLIERLIASGRLGEARQVLTMLKENELFGVLRNDASNDPRLTFAQLTSLEAEWERYGDRAGEDLMRLTRELRVLRKIADPSEDDERRLVATRAELDSVDRDFHDWLDTLKVRLREHKGTESTVSHLNEIETTQGQLVELDPHVAMLSYVVGDDRLSIIFTTATSQVSREVHVTSSVINQLVHSFRRSIEQGLDDAWMLSKTLWGHLMAPVILDLETFGITMLMIVPYGTLRYLPFAALHDGHRFCVERFSISVLTLAALRNMKDQPKSEWQIAALGVSDDIEGYRRISAVEAELASIVNLPPDGTGVYPGKIYLNAAFTEQAFISALERHRVIHIASHFVLNPAEVLNSHLLLGDGSRLTLDRMRAASFYFKETDLITLSACDTAVGGRGDGSDFESFAAEIQRRGAKSVVASLWPVADESTAPLMASFYRCRHAGKSKAEALRAAQLALLAGERYRHPYHWAPFILMGNWL